MVSKWEEDSQHLIADREQDLELAAIFGKMLLDKNKELSDRIGSLEEQLIIANSQVNQARKIISVKNKLLKIYSQDIEDMELKYDSLVKMQRSSDIRQTSLRRKSKDLEDNNQQLQLETFRLDSLISDKEQNEDKLGKDFLERLAKTRDEADILVADLTLKTRENANQEKTIQGLLSKIEKLQKENAEFCSEKISNQNTVERMESSLEESQKEVVAWKDKYDELLHFVGRMQGQFPTFQSWYKPKIPVMPNVSLALELEQSNDTKNGFQFICRSICGGQITKKCWYRGTPDGESESESIAESAQRVEKEKTTNECLLFDSESEENSEKETPNECLLFDSVSEQNSEKEKPKELVHLKQCSELNSGGFDRLSEQWRSSCKDDMTVKHNRVVDCCVPSNMQKCYPRVFRQLEMVKQMEGSVILRRWQQLAVQQKGFALSADLYTVHESCVD